MATGLNNVQIIGYVGGEPSVTKSGETQVAKFSVAVNEVWFDRRTRAKKERTTWVVVVAWGKLGETVGKYVHKGSHVFVQGALQNNNYEKNGVKHFGMQVRTDRIIFLNKVRPNEEAPPDDGAAPPADDEGTPLPEGDVPF